jgi:hypothetical protein
VSTVILRVMYVHDRRRVGSFSYGDMVQTMREPVGVEGLYVAGGTFGVVSPARPNVVSSFLELEKLDNLVKVG